MRGKTTVLFLTHKWDLFTRLKYQRLLEEVGDAADVNLLIQASDEVLRELAAHPTANRSEAIFDPRILPKTLGYPFLSGAAIVPGSTHFPVIAWFREHVASQACLVIEYDVEFSGNWRDFVLELGEARLDFGAMHFRSYRDDPDWYWWRSLAPAAGDVTPGFGLRDLRRSFNPVYWISREAMALVDAAHSRGWRGHYECLMATLLERTDCRLADLAQLGGFCHGREQDLRSRPSASQLATVRWEPQVTQAEFLRRSTGRTLFHPVKEDWIFDGGKIVSVDR